jgi:KDO2-lipid IV(A) lauroyltransferase
MTASFDTPSVVADAVHAAEAPHAPERGWMARRLGRYHVTGAFWFRFHAFGARTPEWFIALIMPLFTAFFFLTIHRIRRAIAANLEAVLGRCGFWRRQRRIWRTLWQAAWAQTERYERLFTDREFDVTARRGERLEEARCGGGFIFLTAHVGNWETASALRGGHGGRRIHVVREEELDPEAQTFVADLLRHSLGEHYVTHFAATDPLLGLALREALERGEIVALQGDRPRRGGRTIEVELFGRPYPLPAGPPALARQTGVPLVPVFVVREGRRRYSVRFGELIRVAGKRERAGVLREAGMRYAAELEEVVREVPHQWFVFRRIWEEKRGGMLS